VPFPGGNRGAGSPFGARASAIAAVAAVAAVATLRGAGRQTAQAGARRWIAVLRPDIAGTDARPSVGERCRRISAQTIRGSSSRSGRADPHSDVPVNDRLRPDDRRPIVPDIRWADIRRARREGCPAGPSPGPRRARREGCPAGPPPGPAGPSPGNRRPTSAPSPSARAGHRRPTSPRTSAPSPSARAPGAGGPCRRHLPFAASRERSVARRVTTNRASPDRARTRRKEATCPAAGRRRARKPSSPQTP